VRWTWRNRAPGTPFAARHALVSGRSKGFGFVEMANDAEAHAAIEALNGSDMNGRPARINEARPRTDGGGGGGGGRGPRGCY